MENALYDRDVFIHLLKLACSLRLLVRFETLLNSSIKKSYGRIFHEVMSIFVNGPF